MKILAATNNAHKISEVSEILSPLGIEVVSPNSLGISADPEENGTTFEENARIKAQAFLEKAGLPVLADDSGLEVKALDGAPGVHSARYAYGSDMDRVHKLLNALCEKADRSARFVSVLALAFPDGRILTARGECPGIISHKPIGENGFGYDPVFFVEQYGKTFAELTSKQKNKISHRGKAFEALKKQLAEFTQL